MQSALGKAILALGLATAFTLGAPPAIGTQPAQAQAETPQEILAAQIRRQGYKCDQPQGAERDAKLDKPDEAVWTLKCESGSYRIHLVPDMAATVEAID